MDEQVTSDSPLVENHGSPAQAGLIAHFSRDNYGNHLVNYAAKTVLEECGYTVDILVPRGESGEKTILSKVRRLPRKLRRLGIRGAIDRVRGRIGRLGARPDTTGDTDVIARRHELFDAFAQEHLRPVPFARERRAELTHSYARFAIGSDQIWNFDYDVDGTSFADFAPVGSAVVLSPSVGHGQIPDEWRASYRRWLARFDEVGIREDEWVASLGQFEGQPRYTQLLDPTLLLDAHRWSEIAADRDETTGRMLVYHLGALPSEDEALIAELSSAHDLPVERLSAHNPGRLWASNASDFIGLIRSADLIVTDSYHGAIFSFLFNRPVVILERRGFAGAMNTRIRTLTSSLGLEDRLASRIAASDALSYDYTDAFDRLAQRREQYNGYLARHGLERRVAGGGSR